jgi:hypothetical protein
LHDQYAGTSNLRPMLIIGIAAAIAGLIIINHEVECEMNEMKKDQLKHSTRVGCSTKIMINILTTLSHIFSCTLMIEIDRSKLWNILKRANASVPCDSVRLLVCKHALRRNCVCVWRI